MNINSIKHIRNRIKVFFKVLGSDFSKLVKENIELDDPFSLTFIKFNKLFIFDLKERIDTLDEEEICILLYFLCIRNDNVGSFIEIFSQINKNRFAIYSERSVSLHKLSN